jgi:hypothetical protein
MMERSDMGGERRERKEGKKECKCRKYICWDIKKKSGKKKEELDY